MQDTLVDLFARSVRLQPQAEALVQGERRINYASLWNAAMVVAARLQQEGLQPGERVALLMDASPEYVAAYYGVLAAGGVTVALNTMAKPPELATCLQHCGARWLLHDGRAVQHQGLASVCAQLNLSEMPLWTAAASDSMHIVSCDCQSAPAAIIYTSATTGAPKGVTLSHRNLVSNVNAIIRYLALTPADRVMHVLPFYYSYGNSVLHTHLAAGATVIIETSLMY